MRVEFMGSSAVKVFGKGLRIESDSDGLVLREPVPAQAELPMNPTKSRGGRPKKTADTPQNQPGTMFDPAAPGVGQ